MRNFKKFLALVLAMLMVSACAVSVSASFTDQAKIDKDFADYAEAIEMLEVLGVVKGDENKNFNPGNTLTRAEAAVIVAKLVAGEAGQSMDWTAETTKFADVDAKWSFAYINYVADRKIMVGTDIGFEPTRELKIDEALTLALKAADPSALRAVEIEYAQAPTAYWATYYINAAEKLGLTDGLEIIYDPEAACSRAMFAQIAYNMITYDNSKIGEGFNLATLEGTLEVVAADTATIKFNVVENNQVVGTDTEKVVRSVFEAALAKSGFEGALTDYIGAEFVVKYNSETGAVFSAALNSEMKVFDSTDAILSINKDANGAYINTLNFAGKTYRANELGANGGSGVIGGAGKYPEITISYLGANLDTDLAEANGDILNGLPTYYKGFAYDDNADGNYDRLVIKAYNLASIKANTADPVKEVKFDTVTFMTVGSFTNKGLNEDKAPIVYTGETAVIDNETPNLVHVSYNAGTNSYIVDVLEVAVKKTGNISGITAGKSLKIGADELAYNAEFVEPAHTTLEQNTTVYTISGKYVKVASVSSSSKTLMVETVKIDANGNAVVTGYNVNNRFAKEEITVVGIVSGANKLTPLGAFRVAATDSAPAQNVYLAEKKDAATTYEFEDGKYYVFTITEKGAYATFEATDDIRDIFATDMGTYDNLSVGDYVKFGTPAVAKYNVASPAIVKMVAATSAYTDIYDAVKYEISTSLSAVQSVKAKFVTNNDGKVTVVILDAATITGDVIIANPLAEGETIVQVIAAAHEVGFAANTYKAVDLINGKVVNVTGNAVVGNYYAATVADYKLGANLDGKWVLDTAVNNISDITVTYGESILPTVSAFPTQLKKEIGQSDSAYVVDKVLVNNGKSVYSTINQIKIYEGEGANNVIKLDGNGKPVAIDPSKFFNRELSLHTGFNYVVEGEAYDTTTTFSAVDTYVVGDTMILVIDIDVTTEFAEIAPIAPAEGEAE